MLPPYVLNPSIIGLLIIIFVHFLVPPEAEYGDIANN
jgi:hypothetical protein